MPCSSPAVTDRNQRQPGNPRPREGIGSPNSPPRDSAIHPPPSQMSAPEIPQPKTADSLDDLLELSHPTRTPTLCQSRGPSSQVPPVWHFPSHRFSWVRRLRNAESKETRSPFNSASQYRAEGFFRFLETRGTPTLKAENMALWLRIRKINHFINWTE